MLSLSEPGGKVCGEVGWSAGLEKVDLLGGMVAAGDGENAAAFLTLLWLCTIRDDS